MTNKHAINEMPEMDEAKNVAVCTCILKAY